MSAPNFSLRYNSQYLYAFLEHSDFEAYVDENADIWGLETEEEINDAKFRDAEIYQEWEADEKDYYLEWLKEEIEKLCQYGTGYYSDFTDSPKIYDSDKVCDVRKYFNFAGGEFMVMAQIDFRAGYYEGFSLDYRFTCVEGTHSWNAKCEDYLPDAQDCEYLLEEETDLNPGLRKALAPKLANKIEAVYDEITAIFEQALKTVSPYHLTGCCASNGEGFYTNHKQDTAA